MTTEGSGTIAGKAQRRRDLETWENISLCAGGSSGNFLRMFLHPLAFRMTFSGDGMGERDSDDADLHRRLLFQLRDETVLRWSWW